MPLPRELVTPPVTKTYFGIARISSASWLKRAFEKDHASSGRQRRTREVSLAHRLPGCPPDAR